MTRSRRSRFPRTLVLAAGRIIAPDRDLTPGYVEIEEGRITAVREGRTARARATFAAIAPGLIDLQVNGAAGVDFLTCERADDLDAARRFLLSTGVTAYLPTLISAPLPQLTAALRRWQEFAVAPAPRVLGVHLEGPYLNPAYAGAHRVEDLRVPDAREFAALLDAAPGLVRLVTFAPELRGADALIEVALKRKVRLAAGHTGISFDAAREAFGRGVRMATHLFNAMRPVHHRDPGIVVAALADDRVVAGLIADFVHVHPEVVRMVIALKGPEGVALVTDAVAAAGTAARTTRLAAREVVVTDAPRLPDGRLAGSLLTLDRAVRNVVSLGLPLRDAVRMASEVPASVLGRRDLGRLAPGAQADLVAFSRGLKVRAVYVAGRPMFPRAANPRAGGIISRPTE